MILALAGRKIDDPGDVLADRFPLSLRWVVRSRLQAFLKNNQVSTVVCSGANGADLLALEVAGNLGLRRVMVLPGDAMAFKVKYVTDRPGNWGMAFDQIHAELQAKGDIRVLADATGEIEKADLACLAVAEEIAKGDTVGAGIANRESVGVVIAWEEGREPFSKSLRDEAKKKGYWVTDISTREQPGDKALLVLNQGGRGLSVNDAMDLHRELAIVKEFNYSRRIFGLIRKDDSISKEDRIRLDQKYALSTYKDVDLPVDLRLEEALRVLKQVYTGMNVRLDQETLSLMGAVYKRKWEADGQQINLEHSFSFYNQAYAKGPQTDDGYSGINAAYILDLLAQNESIMQNEVGEEGLSLIQKDNMDDYRSQATAIRKKIIELFREPPADADAERKYWIFVTVAEAYFGLGEFENARSWLEKAMAIGSIPDWMLETTTRQLAQIALLRPGKKVDTIKSSDAWSVLAILTESGDGDNGALQTAFLGKSGLALSGGGFRAALYHIGVLARLAELDMLRNIEVLSCVSGGSIIGAHYYLEIKHLLETKPDNDIQKADYIRIVGKISGEFLKGVQRNLRTRVISNWWDNFRLFWDPGYSRSLRLGRLYERDIFSRATGVNRKKEKRIMLNKLFIHPRQKEGGLTYQQSWFNPKYDNWRRKNKVPILLLNATTLNTGHNWQFSASWMGESPFTVQKIDGNDRLRRMYYKDGPFVKKPFRREMRLGYAVAASSAVPGLFDPFQLDKLYPGYKVSLVDGGVHDNQGVAGLLEQDCTVMLVSDASGQMVTETQVADNPLSVPMRANDILMERVRNAEYQDLETRRRTGLLKGFLFIHLKMELDIKTVNWAHCEDPQETEMLDRPEILITTYNIRKDIQRLLSNIRTDLDSFHDTEAYALMTSGYQMMAREYPKTIKGFTTGPVEEKDWDFLVMRDELRDIDAPVRTLQMLTVAEAMLFKVWKLSKVLKVAARVLAALALIGLVGVFWYYWRQCIHIPVYKIGWALGLFVVGMFVNKYVIDVLRWRDTFMKVLITLGLVSVIWVVVWVHLAVFDRWYLRIGRRKA
jgi:predicted acylesterase/phospholipase RssA